MKKEGPVIILVVASAILFLIHQYLQLVVQFNLSVLDHYLHPAVLMPLLLYAVLWERRLLLGDHTLTLPYSHILGYFILMVILGEVLLPILSNRFTADYWDTIAYALGTLSYIIARRTSYLKRLNRFC